MLVFYQWPYVFYMFSFVFRMFSWTNQITRFFLDFLHSPLDLNDFVDYFAPMVWIFLARYAWGPHGGWSERNWFPRASRRCCSSAPLVVQPRRRPRWERGMHSLEECWLLCYPTTCVEPNVKEFCHMIRPKRIYIFYTPCLFSINCLMFSTYFPSFFGCFHGLTK